ncbi:hypothetical protein C8R47DRAFT_1197524 [Mycena vitilis]|nr:hypothetical protein C8R47DRAFT_1197524 [Mycena vitilis]
MSFSFQVFQLFFNFASSFDLLFRSDIFVIVYPIEGLFEVALFQDRPWDRGFLSVSCHLENVSLELGILYYFDRVFTVFKLRHRVSPIAEVFIIEKKIRSLLNAMKDTPKFNFRVQKAEQARHFFSLLPSLVEMTVGNGQSARSRTYKALGVSPNATNGLVKGPSFKTCSSGDPSANEPQMWRATARKNGVKHRIKNRKKTVTTRYQGALWEEH